MPCANTTPVTPLDKALERRAKTLDALVKTVLGLQDQQLNHLAMAVLGPQTQRLNHVAMGKLIDTTIKQVLKQIQRLVSEEV